MLHENGQIIFFDFRWIKANIAPYALTTVQHLQRLLCKDPNPNRDSFIFYTPLLFVAQGEAATQRQMPPAESQMCERMTCWPDGPPAVKRGVQFPLTSFFPTEPTQAPTSRLHAENHTWRKESRGGNGLHMNTINDFNADLIHISFSLLV